MSVFGSGKFFLAPARKNPEHTVEDLSLSKATLSTPANTGALPSPAVQGFSFPPRGRLVFLVALVALLGVIPLCVLAQGLAKPPQYIFWHEFSQDASSALLSFLLVALAPIWVRLTWNWPWRRWGNALDANRFWLIGGAFVGYVALILWGTHNIVYTPDEYLAFLQARAFASLHLSAQVSPDLLESVSPKWVQGHFLVLSPTDGRYAPSYWPGYSLLLAPLAALKAEWLGNAILAALTLWLVWALAKRLTQSREGGLWALLITLSSAQVVLQAASYFSMPAHLAFNLLFCLLVIQNTRRSAFLAGLVGGFALVLHNPAPHFSFAFPWIVWLALRRRHQLLPMLFGYTIFFVPLGLGWVTHLGSYSRDIFVAQSAPQAGSSRLVATIVRILYVLRPPDVVLVLARIAGAIKWIVWATPGVAGLAILGYLQLRSLSKSSLPLPAQPAPQGELSDEECRQFLGLLAASAAFNFVLYFLVRFDQGHGWGFRYIHQSWMVLPILAASFLVRQNGYWKRFGAAFCLGGLFLMLPWQAWQMRGFMDDTQSMRFPTPTSSPSITFIQERLRATTFIQNDPFLRNPQWNLRFLSPAQNAAIAKRYLSGARRVQSGEWGETWAGNSFLRSGSPLY